MTKKTLDFRVTKQRQSVWRVELEMLDPTGVVVSKWILKNTMVTSADFGSLDYANDDLTEITLGLRFDYAILAY